MLRCNLSINEVSMMVSEWEAKLLKLTLQGCLKYRNSYLGILKNRVKKFYILRGFESFSTVEGALPEAS